MFEGETDKRQFVDIVIEEEEDQQNLNYLLEKDEIGRYHIQMEKYVKQPSEGLKEMEEGTIK